MISKIQTKVGWEYDINGRETAEGDLGGSVDTALPWRVKYWFGGWDGDPYITNGRALGCESSIRRMTSASRSALSNS